MSRRALPVLTSTGRPELSALETSVRRALDQAHGQLEDLATLPYSAASSADWSGTKPATVGEALDRIAAALGPIP